MSYVHLLQKCYDLYMHTSTEMWGSQSQGRHVLYDLMHEYDFTA